MAKLRIGMLLFPRMTQLDLTGPFEVFSRLPDAEVLLLWKTLEPVEADTGLRLLPYATLRDCPPLDVICVPGGPGVNALMEDAEVLGWLRERARQARYVSSVCTGCAGALARLVCCAGSVRPRTGAHATYWPHSVRCRPPAAWCVMAICTGGRPASISR